MSLANMIEDDRFEAACCHAAYCGRSRDGQTADDDFQGVVQYLASSPPIDYARIRHVSEMVDAQGNPPPDPTQEQYSFDVYCTYHDFSAFGGATTLLMAAVACECDSIEDPKNVAKNAIFEMVLLAGAKVDRRARDFAGTGDVALGSGCVKYHAPYTTAVLDRCTATPAARLARWPAVLAEIRAADRGAAQYAIVRRRFLEICCEGKVDEAGLKELRRHQA